MCICSCNATGQMYERATRSPGACLLIAGLLWALFIITQVLQNTSNAFAQAYEEEEEEDRTTVVVLSGVAGMFALFTTVAGTYFLCVTRRVLREKENISGDTCNDCCVSFWCGCCSLTQMFRHYGMTGKDYRACTVSGGQAV